MFLRQRKGNDRFIKKTSHPIQVPDVQLILSMRTFFTVSFVAKRVSSEINGLERVLVPYLSPQFLY
jgi:hypothetical protein